MSNHGPLLTSILFAYLIKHKTPIILWILIVLGLAPILLHHYVPSVRWCLLVLSFITPVCKAFGPFTNPHLSMACSYPLVLAQESTHYLSILCSLQFILYNWAFGPGYMSSAWA